MAEKKAAATAKYEYVGPSGMFAGKPKGAGNAHDLTEDQVVWMGLHGGHTFRKAGEAAILDPMPADDPFTPVEFVGVLPSGTVEVAQAPVDPPVDPAFTGGVLNAPQ